MRAQATRGTLCIVFALLLTLALAAAPAQANRALITEKAVDTEKLSEGIEGACGVAVGGGKIYVSDHYHRAIEVFETASRKFLSTISAAIAPEGPCELALDSSGALYANLYHERVVRLTPTFQIFDEDNSTGVAVDSSGRVYVNDRTYVAVYETSGAPVKDKEGDPLKVGLGSLQDAYGLAVFAGRIYVPDSAEDRIEVYEPATDPLNPIATINGSATPQHGFVSLTDSDVTVDPTNGHLLVLDNLQPGYEHPKAAIDEFDSTGAFLGQLKQTVIDGEPSGLAVDPASGNLYATSGNSEEATVFAFGPYTEAGPEAVEGSMEVSASGGMGLGPAGVDEAAVVVSGPAARSAARAKAQQRRARRRVRHRRAHHRTSG
jgi:hypothetical protein